MFGSNLRNKVKTFPVLPLYLPKTLKFFSLSIVTSLMYNVAISGHGLKIVFRLHTKRTRSTLIRGASAPALVVGLIGGLGGVYPK